MSKNGPVDVQVEANLPQTSSVCPETVLGFGTPSYNAEVVVGYASSPYEC